MVIKAKKTSGRSAYSNVHLPVQPLTTMQRFADWWSATSPAGKITMITALIASITGAIIGLSHVRPIIEDYWYVAQYERRIDQRNQAVATDRQTLFQLQEYLRRARQDPAATKSETAKEYIKNLEKQIKDTETRIERAVPK